MPVKVYDEIAYPFPKSNGVTLYEYLIAYHILFLYKDCNYSSMLISKLNRVNKRGPSYSSAYNLFPFQIEGLLPKGPYMPCVSIGFLTDT